MSNTTHLRQTSDSIAKFVNGDVGLAIVADRALNLILDSLKEIKGNHEYIQKMLAERDAQFSSDLAELLFSVQSYQQSERLRQKALKRVELEKKFYLSLEKTGGVLKASEAAAIIGVSRQAVNKQRKNKTILAVPKGGDYLYPAFQFSTSGVHEGIKYLLSNTDHVDRLLLTSFLINELELPSGGVTAPYRVLSEKGSRKDVEYIQKQAMLLGKHIAK